MNDSIPQLPEYDPHPDLWARIEADLQADELLSRRLPDLPSYEPKASLWHAIEQNLNTPEPTRVRPLRTQRTSRPLWAGLAAAAVVVLIGSWLLLRPEATDDVRIEYAVEQTDALPGQEPLAPASESLADKRAEEFIARQCAEQQLACQRPEVHELRNQLASLTAEQQRIEREQQIFGNDPVLVQAQVRIENQRAEVTKELITLLRS
ncbi:hypothetical protein [Spirosoma fluviale]|uniref:Uncharacterized protein n=1 Tax=Spirosoma fluviale TaxID=1597977 RepID=A0A286GK50_9BACT|nr:hypothetical protein [Spirosoma fluviale]SOD95913.1 hypothetical protein SAMN06269250_5045 [Spirosoma fluviale]